MPAELRSLVDVLRDVDPVTLHAVVTVAKLAARGARADALRKSPKPGSRRRPWARAHPR